MIIVRSPLRITLGGGGTDLASYYRKYGGFLISAAIDKYVYITVQHPFKQLINLKYSEIESVTSIEKIKHPIFRESLKYVFGNEEPVIEIVSFADIPAGTGLGSSGSFTTALLKALHTYKKNLIHPQELAEQACEIELDRLKEPIGKQDQYIASYGGVTCFEFNKDDTVHGYPLRLSREILYDLEDNLMLFFTGFSRTASSILKEQNDKSNQNNNAMIENLHFIKGLALKSKEALEGRDLKKFAELMNVHWEYKKKRSPMMSNGTIDNWYKTALQNGALAGKLIGAGGGGFFLFYAKDKVRLRHAMIQSGLEEVRFKFDFEGTKVII